MSRTYWPTQLDDIARDIAKSGTDTVLIERSSGREHFVASGTGEMKARDDIRPFCAESQSRLTLAFTVPPFSKRRR